MKKLIADISISPSTGGFQGPGTGLFNDTANSATSFESLISIIIAVMTIIAGIWFMFSLLLGGIGWITAGGDKGQVESARKRISNAVTGLVIVVISVFLVSFVGQVLGVDFLNIAAFITAFSQ